MGFAVQLAGFIQLHLVHLRSSSRSFDGGNSIDDRVFSAGFSLAYLVLDLVNTPGHIIDVRMAGAAGQLGILQRAVDIMHGILGCPVTHIGHMAIGA